MADPIFADPRLAQLYDVFDGDRSDLDLYVALVEELGARSVLDVGCGTGVLACRLAEGGLDVVGVDPATASLDVARLRPGADRVRWVDGDATTLLGDPDVGPASFDLALMTANVAQVFVDDAAWAETLLAVRRCLTPGGRLVFETRVPAERAWEEWTPEHTREQADVAGVGVVDRWCELVEVAEPLVTFRWTLHFASDGAVVASDSTLVFRGLDALETSLATAGFAVEEVRDAPDRPGREWVVVARAV